MVRDKKMQDCNFFHLEFQGVVNNVKGTLFSTCEDTINVNFKNGFDDFVLCNTDFIDNDDVFLGRKDRFVDLQVGDVIAIREQAVKITDFDCETITEFNEFCERCDMEYY